MANRLPAGNPMENMVPSSSEKFLLPSKRTKHHDFSLSSITSTLMSNLRKILMNEGLQRQKRP
jgi:hypothetical protein